METPTETQPSAELNPKQAGQLCSFTDLKGRRWSIELTVGRVRKVQKTLGVDLLDLEGRGISRLYGNALDLADCLYLLCADQAAAAGISDEEFGERLGGDTMEQATEALVNALVFFSPKHLRKPMAVAIQKVDQLRTKQAAACVAWLESAGAAAELEAQLLKTPGDLSGSLRELRK